MKKVLEGVVELMGEHVVLENVRNPKIRRVLHERLRRDSFSFFGKGYKELNNARKRHVDKHKDNYYDGHRDKHRDRVNHTPVHSPLSTYREMAREHSEHKDRGYSESYDEGYSEHTDHY